MTKPLDSTRSRSAKTGEFITKVKAKASPSTTVTETVPKPLDTAAALTLNTTGMSAMDRARLGMWLLSKVWIAKTGPAVYTYAPSKWDR